MKFVLLLLNHYPKFQGEDHFWRIFKNFKKSKETLRKPKNFLRFREVIQKYLEKVDFILIEIEGAFDTAI